MLMELAIRRAEPRDLDAITRVHLASFPGFFLSCLGPRFLRLLYEEILRSDDGVLVVAECAGSVVGLAAGTTTHAAFYRSLLRRRVMAFALAALPVVLRRPVILRRLVRAVRRHTETASPTASLMSIAVDPAAARRGVGGRLVATFCDELRCRGAERVSLTTDAVGNDHVNRFYERHGFHVAQRLTTTEGRVLNEYVRAL